MEYNKCLVQVYEVLNHLEEEEIAKIPEKVIRTIEKRKDKSFIWNYDESKTLNEQCLDRKSVAILSYINIEYLLNEEEKSYIKKLHEENEEKLFPKIGFVNFSKPVNYDMEERKTEEVNLIEIKKQKWYEKIFMFFKKIFVK